MLIFSCDWIPRRTQAIVLPLFTCSVPELYLVLLRRWKRSCKAWDGYAQIIFTASKLLLWWISGILPREEGKIWAVHVVCVNCCLYPALAGLFAVFVHVHTKGSEKRPCRGEVFLSSATAPRESGICGSRQLKCSMSVLSALDSDAVGLVLRDIRDPAFPTVFFQYSSRDYADLNPNCVRTMWTQ